MKVLVTGVKGQLGYDMIKCLSKRNIECIGTDIEEFDITDEGQTKKYIINYHPDIVVHAAAYTAVDKAETDKERCEKVNAAGTRAIAQACLAINAVMVYISTEYIFQGDGEEYYETDAKPNPLSVYGRTKLEGELAVKELLTKYFIVRISWAFGKNGNNFIRTMMRLGKEKEEISVVHDQIGSPTYTKDLSVLLCDMLETSKYGTYHATNENICSWAELAEEIFKIAKYPTKVKRISSEEYKTEAVRPKNSRLSKKSLDEAGFVRLPDWKDAVKRYLKEEFNI